MIPLAILCAVLVAVIAWQRSTVRSARERARGIEVYTDNARQELIATINRLDANLAIAYTLLHDERHKGRLENQKAWQAARDEWDSKVNGVGK